MVAVLHKFVEQPLHQVSLLLTEVSAMTEHTIVSIRA